MNEVLEIATRIALFVLVVLQWVMVGHMLYTGHRRFKEDQEFWRKQSELSAEYYKHLKESADTKESAEDGETTKNKK